MSTDVGICNRALAMIGQPPITALVDDPSTATNKAVMWASLLYPEVLLDLLATHPWRWASKRATLDEDTVEEPDHGYEYAFYLPSDWVRMCEPSTNEILYSVEGGRVLTNVEEFQCRYVYAVEDPELFPRIFIKALAAQLAAELAIPLAGKERLTQFWGRMALQYLNQAKATDATGEQPDEVEDSWISARR